MKNKIDFSKLLQFFREKPPALPGDSIFNDKFCEILVAASSAEEASIWQLDSKNQLHPVNGTNFTFEEVRDVILNEGEGIGGAVVISRRTMVVSHALSDPRHDPQMDERIDFRTHSMISAPILFGDKLYGVVNILNHESGKAFPLEWEEKLSIAGILYAAALAAAGRLTLYDEPRIKDERKNTQFPIDKTVVVGASWAIQELLQLCVKAGRSDVPVLIRGETGTGKELAAERIHQASKRSGEFITINSAGLPETLLESELFGHVKGAFTGASKDKKGHFELADEGTLFLDEIGDMSLACQAKILRALQEKKISPVGSEKNITCDVRIIAATNRDLRKMMEEGSFRDDLFYRVCAIEVLMPPLRERPDDIPLLVNYFLKRAGAEGKKQNPAYQLPKISAEALEMLMAFKWPGNVRELENAVLASLALCETDEIQPSDFPFWLQNDLNIVKQRSIIPSGQRDSHQVEKTPMIGSVEYFGRERLRYQNAIEETKYSGTNRPNLSAAARQLGIPRKTFVYRAKKMKLIS